MADGTTYQIDIPVDASQVGAAGTAVERLEAQLKAAGAASAAAGEAVKAGAIAYNQAESAANKAAAAAGKIGMAAEALRGKLAEAMEVGDMAGIASAEAALESLGEKEMAAAEKAAAARDVLQQKATALDALKDAAKAAGAAEDKLAGDLDKMKKAGTGGSIKLNGWRSRSGSWAARGHGWPEDRRHRQRAPEDGGDGACRGVHRDRRGCCRGRGGHRSGDGGVAQVRAGERGCARTSALLSQGIAGSVDGGKALDKTIASLGTKVPMTAAELQTMAGQLAKTGLKGDALSVALEDAAVKASKLKFGPDFAKAMLSADFQSKKLKADVGKIFGGLKIEGLLTNLAKLGALFDERDSSSAKAIKVVFESFFQPLVDGMEGMIPKVIAGFIQVEIWAAKGLIGIQRYQPVIDAVRAAMLFRQDRACGARHRGRHHRGGPRRSGSWSRSRRRGTQ